MSQPSTARDRERGKPAWWRREWTVPAALSLLPWLVFLPATAMRGVFAFGDIQAYFYPYHVLPAALLRAGELPLWNPYAFSGMPLLPDGQTALFHPSSWLFFVLPAAVALNYGIVMQFSVAGVGTYLLLRGLGPSQLPSAVGAITYMFCGAMTARILHLSILAGAALMPWVVLCVDRAFGDVETPAEAGGGARSRPAWVIAAAGVIAIQVFAGHPQVPVYTALAAGAYALVRGFERWRVTGRPASMTGPAAVVTSAYLLGGALSAVQLLPWAELATLSTRAAGASFDMVFNTSMARSEWLLQLFPYLYGSLRPGPFGAPPGSTLLVTRFVEHSAYVGILPAGLAVAGLAGLVGWRSSGETGLHSRRLFHSVVFFALLAAVGLLLAVGWGTPLAHLVYRTPVLGKLRAVERALVLVDFAAAGLAAFGLQRVMTAGGWSRRPRRSLQVIGTAMAAVPAAIVLVSPQPWFQRAMSLPREAASNLALDRPNAIAPILLALVGGALFWWWSRRRPSAAILAIAGGLVLVDLGTYAALYFPTEAASHYNRRPDVLAALDGPPGAFRKATFLPAGTSDVRTQQAILGMSWGMVYGVEDVNGFNSLQTRRYTDYLFGTGEGDVSYGLLRDDRLLRPESPVLSSLNVRALLVPAGTSPHIGAGYRLAWKSAEVELYENTLAYPRAFFADAVRGMTEAPAVLEMVTADGFDGRRLAVVETGDPPSLPVPVGPDAVTEASRTANRIAYACTTATSRFLVLSEMYFPGWEARVDGEPAEIYRTNYLFRGVVVPAGRHAVTFEYRPRSLPVGAALSGLALFVAVAVLVVDRRRRQKMV